MAGSQFVFNISLGSVAEKVRDGGGTWRMLFLEAAEADDTLRDYDTISALLGAAGNTESTGATRQALTNVVLTVDDTANTAAVDADDVVFTPSTDSKVVKILIYHDPDGTDTDTANVPAAAHPDEFTPEGNEVTIQISDLFVAS